MSNSAIRQVNAFDIDRIDSRSSLNFQYEEVSECPMCHTSIVPGILDVFYLAIDSQFSSFRVFVINFCPKCRKVFVCQYDAYYCGMLKCEEAPVSIAPKTFQKITFSNSISQLSPYFVKTYNESVHAESLGLVHICGAGYRKSLEFLVKDYLCHIHPEEENKIKTEFLGNSISRIENIRIKTLASRCAWIGNDETHYVKKHDDRGTDDIKRFINAMLHYIESELAFEEAESIEHK